MNKIIIAAIGTDGVIGSDNGMPWHVPEEYEHYLRCIYEQTVIMGRKSWEIFNKDLTTTKNIVVSSRGFIKGAVTASDLESALQKAETLKKLIFIAGGASIYTQALEYGYVDQMYLSTIYGDYEGDCYFPKWNQENWTMIRKEQHTRFEFVVWQKTKPTPLLMEK